MSEFLRFPGAFTAAASAGTGAGCAFTLALDKFSILFSIFSAFVIRDTGRDLTAALIRLAADVDFVLVMVCLRGSTDRSS
jgi:hypothetical protein